jgi:hypothetical protein
MLQHLMCENRIETVSREAGLINIAYFVAGWPQGERVKAGAEPMVYFISTFLFFAACAAAVLFAAHRAVSSRTEPKS